MAFDDTFTAEVPKKIAETSAFEEWEASTNGTNLERVEAAKEKIQNEGVVTSAKSLNDGLYEKKWKSGLRLYFAVVKEKDETTLLILGSGKGKEQDKAIKEARKILTKYTVYKGDIR